MHCYIFDIDGTLADITHRLYHIQKEPKNWDAFFDACVDDKPISHMCNLAHIIKTEAGRSVIFVSGRPERIRRKTAAWLNKHVTHLYDTNTKLCMRADGDHRPDDVVKRELLDRIRKDGYEPVMAFDDRSRVVKMWRENGVPCAQVAEGDF